MCWHRSRLAPSPNIFRRRALLFAKGSTPKRGWKRATGSVRSAAALKEATCSPSITAIRRLPSLTSATCAGRFLPIKTIAPANFTALESWGKRSGLETAGFTSQTAFLLALGRGNEFADLYDEGQTEAERTKARLQLKT